MRNFNTNQTRFLYVASQINANVAKDRNAADSAAASKLDINLGQTITGELFFSYKNADGLITRSDSIDPKKIKSLKKTAAADLATKLLSHTIAIKTANYADLAALKGKTIKLTVTVHQVFDFDDSNVLVFPVVYTVPSTESSLTTMYQAIDALLDDTGVAKFGTISSSGSGVVITEKQQKYVRGKLSGEPVKFSVAFDVAGDNEPEWGTDTVAVSGSTIGDGYVLADLEDFCNGEKGDYYRGFAYPCDYNPEKAINPASTYDVLSIEYFWAGNVENVQKSPRLIQVAGSQAIVNTLYSSVKSAMDGETGSGSGA